MTEPAESTAAPAHVAERSAYHEGTQGPSRLGQVAAVVGIVAGVVFVIALVFFTGVFVGGQWAGYGGPDGSRNTGQVRPGGKPDTCPMMKGGGMSGGMMGPGPSGTPSPSGTTTVPRP